MFACRPVLKADAQGLKEWLLLLLLLHVSSVEGQSLDSRQAGAGNHKLVGLSTLHLNDRHLKGHAGVLRSHMPTPLPGSTDLQGT